MISSTNKWILVVGILLYLPAFASVYSKPIAESVIIVSIDGGSPAVIQESKMPTFFKMAEQGAHSYSAKTITPSITLPSHVSMLSGVGPEVHQVTWNDWKPEKGLVTVPTVFQVTKQAGRKTAIFASKDKFRHLNVPGSLDEFKVVDGDAEEVATEAAHYFLNQRPQLVFVHFRDADKVGHFLGWGSRWQKKALATVDKGLQTLKAAVESSGIPTVFIVTADHGGSGLDHKDDIPENRTIPWVVWGSGVQSHLTISKEIHTVDTAATALYILGIPEQGNWSGKPVVEAFIPNNKVINPILMNQIF